jgi:hypothetical protein
MSLLEFRLHSIHSPHTVDCLKRRLCQVEDALQYFLIRCHPLTEVLVSGEIAVATLPGNAFWHVIGGGLSASNQLLLSERCLMNNYKTWHFPYLLIVPPKLLEVSTVAPVKLEIYTLSLVCVVEKPLGLGNIRYSGRNDQRAVGHDIVY